MSGYTYQQPDTFTLEEFRRREDTKPVVVQPEVCSGSCEACGSPIPTTTRSRKWCSNACACRGYYKRNAERERMRAKAKYERRKASA